MKKIYIYIILIILWLGAIFMFSNQSGDETQSLSKSVINNIVEIYENVTKSDVDNQKIVNKLNYYVRKTAHIIEYFVLCILAFLLINNFNIDHKLVFCILFCILCASLDEIHQAFAYNRTSSVMDVFIDSLGSILSVLLIHYKINKKNKIGTIDISDNV